MGAKQSSVHNDIQSWLVIDDEEGESLNFTPTSSYAVCAGIGQQIKISKGHLGPAADNDAIVVARTLVDIFNLPKENVHLLYSRERVATKQNILTSVRKCARAVGKDGLLILQFAGHVQRNGTDAVLIPADYTTATSSVISVADLVKAVKGSSAKYFLLLMDCCHAGQVATNLVVKTDLPTYVMASCTSTQRSLSFKDLGHGFFTYFLVRYLNDYGDSVGAGDVGRRAFPVTPAVNYCKPLCSAVAALISPTFGSDMSMNPMVVRNTWGRPRSLDLDVTDFVPANSMTYLVKYERLYRRDELAPVWEHAEPWLTSTARASMATLFRAGLLQSDRDAALYASVLAFITQAALSHVYRQCKRDGTNQYLYMPLCFIEVFKTILETALVLDDLEPVKKPDVHYFCHSLQHYIVLLIDIDKRTYSDPAVRELLLLLTVVLHDCGVIVPADVTDDVTSNNEWLTDVVNILDKLPGKNFEPLPPIVNDIDDDTSERIQDLRDNVSSDSSDSISVHPD